MSKQGTSGIRAAKGLLGLLEENSAEDFEAAMSILGSQRELVDILQLLTNYQITNYQKRAQEPDPKSKTVEDLAELVRAELLALGIAPLDMAAIAKQTITDTIESVAPFPVPSRAKLEDVVARVVEWIDTQIDAPRDQARVLLELVLRAARFAGLEHEEKVADSLRALTVEALAGNFVMFSDFTELGDLRRRWSEKPLSRLARESRRHFASRLLNDAQMNAPEMYQKNLEGLLLEGLRSPTDTAATLMRKMDLHKTSASRAIDNKGTAGSNNGTKMEFAKVPRGLRYRNSK